MKTSTGISRETRFNNKLKIMSLLRTAIYNVQKDIELTKKNIEESYFLLQESLHCTFICVDGLQPLVLNEIEDAKNHNKLDLITEKFYKNIFCKIFSLGTENYEGTNVLSYSRGKLKRLINPVRGFQSMKTAYATIKGFEIMRMFKKGQFNI
ncbi:transposase [Legionella steelei]|uniref:Transposase n=1 Tax=Legionella steelei TaxID=947033 RepID=A0A0W0ZHP3_9GAMM|nr:transposase [Legionella steelei]